MAFRCPAAPNKSKSAACFNVTFHQTRYHHLVVSSYLDSRPPRLRWRFVGQCSTCYLIGRDVRGQGGELRIPFAVPASPRCYRLYGALVGTALEKSSGREGGGRGRGDNLVPRAFSKRPWERDGGGGGRGGGQEGARRGWGAD